MTDLEVTHACGGLVRARLGDFPKPPRNPPRNLTGVKTLKTSDPSPSQGEGAAPRSHRPDPPRWLALPSALSVVPAAPSATGCLMPTHSFLTEPNI